MDPSPALSRVRLLGCAVLLLLVSATKDIAAQEGVVYLEWSDPEQGCASKQEIERKVEHTLGKYVFSADREKARVITLSARPGGDGVGWKATIRADWDPEGQGGGRALETESHDCRQLDDSIALVVALMIDEFISTRETSPTVEHSKPTENQEPKNPEKPEDEEASPSPAPENKGYWEAFVAAQALAAYELLPGISWGAELRLELKGPRGWPAYFRLTAWPKTQTDGEDAKGSFSAWSLTLGMCPRLLSRDKVMISLCFGLLAGMVRAKGERIDTVETALRPLVQAEAGLSFRFAIAEPIWVILGVGASVTLMRDRFEYTADDGRTRLLHRANPVVPMISLGVELRVSRNKNDKN